MKTTSQKLATLDWQKIALDLSEKGYAIIPRLLSNKQCSECIDLYDRPNTFRKTVVMERHRFGKGEYKYFCYPLPTIVQTIRENMYPKLALIANKWMHELGIAHQFPHTLSALLKQCHLNNQLRPTPLILKYGKGGFNTLHQDLYGTVYFPLQTVLFLNEPEIDFTGGEFVLTQQLPRAQSKAIVLRPKKGDMLLFTTQFRPVKGDRGYYRAHMKHGVSEVHTGNRHTLGVIFHDATT